MPTRDRRSTSSRVAIERGRVIVERDGEPEVRPGRLEPSARRGPHLPAFADQPPGEPTSLIMDRLDVLTGFGQTSQLCPSIS